MGVIPQADPKVLIFFKKKYYMITRELMACWNIYSGLDLV